MLFERDSRVELRESFVKRCPGPLQVSLAETGLVTVGFIQDEHLRIMQQCLHYSRSALLSVTQVH